MPATSFIINNSELSLSQKARGCTVVGGTALQAGWSRFRFPMVPLEFSIDIKFRSHCDPRVDSSSNRNEYQEYFLGVKTAGAKGSSYADCLEIFEPQPPGTQRACSGLYRDCFTFVTKKIVYLPNNFNIWFWYRVYLALRRISLIFNQQIPFICWFNITEINP